MHRATAHLMGTEAEVLLHRPGRLTAARVLDRLADLEARWSRFLPGSELSRCGAAARRGPAAVVVSPETASLVERLRWGWWATEGRFDPTVVDSLEALGYDRDLDDVRSLGPRPTSGPVPGRGCEGVRADPATGLVRLPAGVRLDPGGCGKGLAADLAVVEALDAGAAGALVSVGGDLRAAGEAPPQGWPVEVDHGSGPTVALTLRDGALATSSTLRRRWPVHAAGAGPAAPRSTVHHVVDPATGRPTAGRVVAVTVLAPEAWLAEVLATAVLVADGAAVGPVAEHAWSDGGGALLTEADGIRRRLGAFPAAPEDIAPGPGGAPPGANDRDKEDD